MKKTFLFFACVVIVFFATGCEKVIELTDNESKLIAEYAAELLLKYDRNIDYKYFSGSESTTEVITEISTSASTEATTTETVSEITTDVSTDNAVVTETPTTEEDITDESTEEEVSGIVANQDQNFNIATFLGEENLSIKYSYYMILDRYPSYDQDGVYIEIEAPAGYKLLVLKFNVENMVNDKRNIDLYNKNVEYHVVVNNNRSAKQMLTILIDDLYTYQKQIEGSMFEEDVLLFQISESLAANLQDLKLRVEYDGSEVVLQLQ